MHAPAGGRAGARLRQALIVAEVALSVVLLLGAGLMMRSFIKLQAVNLGFSPGGLLTMRLTLPQQKYPTGEDMTSFFEELARRVREVPGVTRAGWCRSFRRPRCFPARSRSMEAMSPARCCRPRTRRLPPAITSRRLACR